MTIPIASSSGAALGLHSVLGRTEEGGEAGGGSLVADRRAGGAIRAPGWGNANNIMYSRVEYVLYYFMISYTS